jgi:hypothetical protein
LVYPAETFWTNIAVFEVTDEFHTSELEMRRRFAATMVEITANKAERRIQSKFAVFALRRNISCIQPQ